LDKNVFLKLLKGRQQIVLFLYILPLWAIFVRFRFGCW